jgi:hypothetical protein
VSLGSIRIGRILSRNPSSYSGEEL